MVRIVDYKSGKDRRQFESVESLFGDNEKKRNKAVFQLLFYTMILERQGSHSGTPAMYSANEIYRENFDPLIQMGRGAGAFVPDIGLMRNEILPQFKDRVHELIREIFDPEIPFKHRDPEIPCKFCNRAGFPT